MPVTTAQAALIKADILAKSDLNATPNTSDGAWDIGLMYQLPSNPVVMVWRTDARIKDIFDAITWASYTPVDVVPTTTTLDVSVFHARLLVIQTKQMNLQNITIGRDALDCTKANIRSGLRDAVIALPAGAGGANIVAGGASGATVLAACTRVANRLEALLVTGLATTGSTAAQIMGYEGSLNYAEIVAIRNN